SWAAACSSVPDRTPSAARARQGARVPPLRSAFGVPGASAFRRLFVLQPFEHFADGEKRTEHDDLIIVVRPFQRCGERRGGRLEALTLTIHMARKLLGGGATCAAERCEMPSGDARRERAE